jgi:prepilin-type N-terminal cleavage/methylation domain-containing protein
MKRNDALQAGFTVVELLVALALTAMIASFILGGLDLARRAWIVSRDRETAEEIDAAAAQLRSLLSRATPATTIDEGDRLARLLFEGQRDSVTFVTLSEATAFQGGLMRVRLSWQNSPPLAGHSAAVVLRIAVFRANPRLVVDTEPVVLFRDVVGFSLQYFGAPEFGKPPQWQTEWIGRERLPLLVRAQVNFAGKGGVQSLILPVPVRLATS